ncbi:hypothetical protein [Janthinobacterium sp.]|uniref:hypothetical protein n=1 Tax=Janthinobacterium sp. TaxID=1871054 RepID=UPI00262156FD|nr:hypothetical protein [Janthinobacterium sp.]
MRSTLLFPHRFQRDAVLPGILDTLAILTVLGMGAATEQAGGHGADDDDRFFHVLSRHDNK